MVYIPILDPGWDSFLKKETDGDRHNLFDDSTCAGRFSEYHGCVCMRINHMFTIIVMLKLFISKSIEIIFALISV